MTTHTFLNVVEKLLPYAEAEQENLRLMAKQNPDEYQAGYEDCRHAVSYAHEALQQQATPVKRARKGKRLPPDPEGMNDDRSEWAAAALRHFQCTTGTDYDDALTDLLCDLMHWCDRNGVAFAAKLDGAQRHYEAETTPIED